MPRVVGSDRGDHQGLAAALTPHHRVVLEPAPSIDGPEPEVAARIRTAFDLGHGRGILELGAAEIDTPLPPTLAFWRELGRRFVTHLCGLPADAGAIEVPPPADELSSLAQSAPPMKGAEYLGTETLTSIWTDMNRALGDALKAFDGSVEAYLRSRNPAWHQVGRVHFHLAENKRDADRPFAFLATYTTRLSREGKAQHRPLGQAMSDFGGAGNRKKLLALLEPVQRASEKSEFLRRLVDSKEVFHPLAWGAAEAYGFLKEIPLCESAGVVVKVPDWWKSRRPPRPEVRVTVGMRTPAGLGLDALLDFNVQVTLDGERLTAAELKRLLASSEGLALLKGKWVELSPEKLKEALEQFEKVQSLAGRDGVTLLEGMRLLAGAPIDADSVPAPEASRDWSQVVAGPWFAETLNHLRRPESLAAADPGRELKTELRPYQKAGLHWLWFLDSLGLGACLADDMGLGKTIQVLALLLVLKKENGRGKADGPALLVVPASLIANWQSEIGRFSPSLSVFIAHPSAGPEKPLGEVESSALSAYDLVITTYGFAWRLPWLAKVKWRLLVLDEAQAIKNAQAKQTRAVKALQARSRIVLTGTPVENHLGDLWSLFDFLNPGLLGTAKAFGDFAKRLADQPNGGYAPLRNLTRPYVLRRLKTDKSVIADLPEKTEVKAYCALTKAQAALYQESVASLGKTLSTLKGIERRGVVLAYLMRFKQICNHPSQWLGDESWNPEASGKFARLRELGEVIAEKQEKVLVFTQFREMTGPLLRYLEGVFNRRGLVLHGETPVKDRQGLVTRFQEDESVPFFVLSVKAGGTGLNLTAASHVIHFDRWWNPAVENQATDRAFRIGQKRNVLVHKFVCRGTIEEKVDELIESKQSLSRELLGGGEGAAEKALTELDDAALLKLVSLDLAQAVTET
jgi:superfamily II DNA or RNA helicase